MHLVVVDHGFEELLQGEEHAGLFVAISRGELLQELEDLAVFALAQGVAELEVLEGEVGWGWDGGEGE